LDGQRLKSMNKITGPVSIKDIAAAYESLSKRDLRVLMVIEALHRYHEYVPLERLLRWLKENEDSTLKSIRQLNKYALVSRSGGLGYRLTFRGYDVLAIHALAKMGIIESLSPSPIGSGKESDVYATQLIAGGRGVVKFHRLGRISFRNVRKYRLWLGERRHVSWLYESRISAHMEYVALVGTYKAGVPVPQPIAVNRHAVVMSYIDGEKLADANLSDPATAWEQIMNAVKTAFEAGYIHGDLSEFNIIMAGDKPYLIDWPQWVPTKIIGSMEKLINDIKNLAFFFARKYDYRPNIDPIIEENRKMYGEIHLEKPDATYSKLLDELMHMIRNESGNNEDAAS